MKIGLFIASTMESEGLVKLLDRVIKDGPIRTGWEISEENGLLPENLMLIFGLTLTLFLIVLFTPLVIAIVKKRSLEATSSFSHIVATLLTLALVIIMPAILIELMGRGFAMAGKMAISASDKLTESLSSSISQVKDLSKKIKRPNIGGGSAGSAQGAAGSAGGAASGAGGNIADAIAQRGQ